MQSTILLNKPLTLTPLQAVGIFRKKYPEYATETIGYAGRLDPMAEGLLLLLINDENKKKQIYEDLSKTYRFCVIPGISTDTYDLLGKITQTNFGFDREIITEKLPSILSSLEGTHSLPYPPYSSRTVKGKPLFWWAREGRLSEITIPTKVVTISTLKYVSVSPLPSHELREYLQTTITNVSGEFRQDEILSLWEEELAALPSLLQCLSFEITCTSGTYVRQIVHEIGEKMTIPMVTMSIQRTAIGEYTLEDALSLEDSQNS